MYFYGKKESVALPCFQYLSNTSIWLPLIGFPHLIQTYTRAPMTLYHYTIDDVPVQVQLTLPCDREKDLLPGDQTRRFLASLLRCILVLKYEKTLISDLSKFYFWAYPQVKGSCKGVKTKTNHSAERRSSRSPISMRSPFYSLYITRREEDPRN